MNNERPEYWWAGIATVLPRTTLLPPAQDPWIRLLNRVRLRFGLIPAFPVPRLTPDRARYLARPTNTGLGDLLLAWLMPITVAVLLDWRLRIPVPSDAGVLRPGSGRPPLLPSWLERVFALPPNVRLVAADVAPRGVEWFCTIEQQWYLNACMETSFDTIPPWVETEQLNREAYYQCYASVARGLLPVKPEPATSTEQTIAIHIRRGDRGNVEDDRYLENLLTTLSGSFKNWAVVSDSADCSARLGKRLLELGCRVLTKPKTGSLDALDAQLEDFLVLATAGAVVSSVAGGWSAFSYAATRLSGKPLLVASEWRDATAWRVLKRHSRVPIRNLFVGRSDVDRFSTTIGSLS